MQQKEVILEGTIKAFNEKGLKFTMDDVAKILGMSKKTIYTVFRDKESMFLAMVDYMFDSIKESEQQIVEDDALSTVEKIRRILGVIPESGSHGRTVFPERHPDSERAFLSGSAR